MKKIDIFIISILFVGAFLLLISPKNNDKSQVSAKEILREIQNKHEFISVDALAKKIIENDPTILLVDVRNAKEFKKFSLNNAINIPQDSLFTETSASIFEQQNMKIIFYSTGTSLASEAWITVRQKGYKNLYVLRGGLNEWFSTILNPEEPQITDAKADFDTYKFRVAAKQYFTGVKVDNQQNSGSSTTIKGNTSKKKKKGASGGCS